MKKIIPWVLLVVAVYWLPFVFIYVKASPSIVGNVEYLPRTDAGLIFGANLNNGEVSPVLKERLEAGKIIWEKEKAQKLVVSNMSKASLVMQNYLLENGVPKNAIELDEQAKRTKYTCLEEKKNYSDGRKVIFISQGYHLPRLIYQCQKIGVEGVGFPAENLDSVDRSGYSLFTRAITRARRYAREAGIMWLVVLRLY